MRSVWLGLVCSVRCIGRLSVWNSERFCGLESAVGKLRENERGARQGGGAARSGGGVTLSLEYFYVPILKGYGCFLAGMT